MPLEVKHIYFTESELRKALVNFSVLKKQYFEIEDVQKTIIDKADSVTVSLLVDKALEFKNDKLTYSHAEVAASLFAFCMVSKIPLPRRGIKELHADDDKVYLTIRLDEEVNFEKYVISNTMKTSLPLKAKYLIIRRIIMQGKHKAILFRVLLILSLIGILPLLAGPGTALGLWEPISGFRMTMQYMTVSIVSAALLLALLLQWRFRNIRKTVKMSVLIILIFGSGYYLGINKEPEDLTGLRGIHDVSTDTINPPEFITLLDAPGRRNDFVYDGRNRMRQLAKFPWVQPITSDMDKEEAFDLALKVASDLNWDFASLDKENGRIEATDYTKWFNFHDDVVIRISELENGSRIDLRSLSRVGGSDHGLGAMRIMRFTKAFNQQ